MQNAEHRARVKGVIFLGVPGHYLFKIHTLRTGFTRLLFPGCSDNTGTQNNSATHWTVCYVVNRKTTPDLLF